jgi:hypothetical protein
VDPILLLEEPYLQVEPGAELRTRLRVRNGGTEPGRYRLEVLGDAARWTQVEPRQVAVPPDGQDQLVDVVFRPPHAGAAPALAIPFGVRAYAVEDRERAAVVEGDVLVTAVPDLVASIDPPAAVGRWGADYRVRFTHSGRAPVTLRVTATDPPRALRYAVAPAQVSIAPGGGVEVLVAVRLRAPKLAGAPARHSFTVDYRADTATSAGRLPGVFEQRGVLPGVAVGVLTAVAAVLLAGVAFLAFGGRSPSAAPPAAAGGPAVGPAAPAAGNDVVRGFLVLYGPPTPVDDVAGRGNAERFLARLQAAGVNARIVDSRNSAQLDDGPRGLLVVLRDGFPDRSAAQAECAAHRDIAPGCVVVGPR